MSFSQKQHRENLREFASSRYAKPAREGGLSWDFPYLERDNSQIKVLKRFWDKLYAFVGMAGEVWRNDGSGWEELENLRMPSRDGGFARGIWSTQSAVWKESTHEKYLIIGGHEYRTGKNYLLIIDQDEDVRKVSTASKPGGIVPWNNAIYFTAGGTLYKTYDDPVANDFEVEGSVVDTPYGAELFNWKWGNGNLFICGNGYSDNTYSTIHEWDGTDLTTHTFADYGNPSWIHPLRAQYPDWLSVVHLRKAELWRYDGTSWTRVLVMPKPTELVTTSVGGKEVRGANASITASERGSSSQKWVIATNNSLYLFKYPGVVKRIYENPQPIYACETWNCGCFIGTNEGHENRGSPSRYGMGRAFVKEIPYLDFDGLQKGHPSLGSHAYGITSR